MQQIMAKSYCAHMSQKCNHKAPVEKKVLPRRYHFAVLQSPGLSWCSIAPLRICTSHLPGENLHTISTSFELLLKTTTIFIGTQRVQKLTYKYRAFPRFVFFFSTFARVPLFCIYVSFTPFWPDWEFPLLLLNSRLYVATKRILTTDREGRRWVSFNSIL